MRTIRSLLSGLALTTVAVANNASLYFFDIGVPARSSHPVIVSSSQGLSILARRRGITGAISIGDASQSEIELLNYYGGYQQSIFDQGSQRPVAKVFLQIAGHDHDAVHLDNCDSSIIITQPSLQFDSLQGRKVSEECAALSDRVGSYRLYVENLADMQHTTEADGDCQPLETFERHGLKPLSFLTTAISQLASSCPQEDSSPCHFASQLPALCSVLANLAANHQVQSTLLITPRAQNPTMLSHMHHRRAESPLDLPPVTSKLDSETTDGFAASRRLQSNLPTCFVSESACVNTTNSCSGHGTCVKSVPNSKCFQCKCHRTVVQANADGSKKYWDWGGKACEKKDVSVPFFLFASFGVVMLSLITGGIGLLYSMGSQELPSVLGAGVAGPRAQK